MRGILPLAKSTTSPSEKLLDSFGVDASGKEFVHWQRQTNLFEVFASIGYAEGQKKLLWSLPAHGDSYVDCGETRVKGCDRIEKHEDHMVFGRTFKRNCGRKACPTCYEAWASSQALRGLIRLSAFAVGFDSVDKAIFEVKSEFKVNSRRMQRGELVVRLEQLLHSARRKVIHVVLSPNPGIIDESMTYYMRSRRLAYEIAKECGLKGGAVIFHPYRLKCSKCGSTIDDYTDSCSKCGASSFSWVWSPHFHVLGFGWIINTAETYEKRGWIVKNLGVRKSVYWTFQYILSHAGVSKVHTTTWFGDLAYNMLRAVPTLGVFHEVCPYCHAPLMPLLWIGGEDRGPPADCDKTVLEFDPKSPIDNEYALNYEDWRVYQGNAA
jgi:RNA polymerase subunit RPABC4/transcription elongation factor Spt4